jgi:hypothetical protein
VVNATTTTTTPASITYNWGDLQQLPGAGLSNDDVAKGIFWDETEQWDTGENIAVCNDTSWYNWLGPIARNIGRCARGVSAIDVEEGASYLIILYNGTNFTATGRGNAPGLVINGSVPDLKQLRFNERAGGMFVIKVKQ